MSAWEPPSSCKIWESYQTQLNTVNPSTIRDQFFFSRPKGGPSFFLNFFLCLWYISFLVTSFKNVSHLRCNLSHCLSSCHITCSYIAIFFLYPMSKHTLITAPLYFMWGGVHSRGGGGDQNFSPKPKRGTRKKWRPAITNRRPCKKW